jgi:hypothetical protein
VCDGADHHEDVRLPRRKARQLGAEARVVVRGPAAAMYSMPQQAVTKGYWKKLQARPQLTVVLDRFSFLLSSFDERSPRPPSRW